MILSMHDCNGHDHTQFVDGQIRTKQENTTFRLTFQHHRDLNKPLWSRS